MPKGIQKRGPRTESGDSQTPDQKRINKIAKNLQVKFEKQTEAFENALSGLDDDVADLIEHFNKSKQKKKITRSFTSRLHDAVKKGNLTTELAHEILSQMQHNFPELNSTLQKFLETHNLMLLDTPRNLMLGVFPEKSNAMDKAMKNQSGNTVLSLYNFDTEGTQQHPTYFNIRTLKTSVTKSLKVHGFTWDSIPQSLVIRNPVYHESHGEAVPEKLDYWKIQRLKMWYDTYLHVTSDIKKLSKANREELEHFDLRLYPKSVLEADASLFGSIWSTAKRWMEPVVGKVANVVDTVFRNQFILMIIRNVVCIGVVLFLSSFFDFAFSTREFLVELLLGFFLQNAWNAAWPILVKGHGYINLSFLGPLGNYLSTFFSAMWAGVTGVIPPSAAKSGASSLFVYAMLYFGSAWLPGLLQMSGMFGIGLGVYGFDVIARWWRTAADDIFRTFNGTFTRDAGTLSNLFSVMGVRYVCQLFGLGGKHGRKSYCEQLTDVISFVMSTTSIGYILWDIISSLHILTKLRHQKGKISLKTLQEFQDRSSCIRALVAPQLLKVDKKGDPRVEEWTEIKPDFTAQKQTTQMKPSVIEDRLDNPEKIAEDLKKMQKQGVDVSNIFPFFTQAQCTAGPQRKVNTTATVPNFGGPGGFMTQFPNGTQCVLPTYEQVREKEAEFGGTFDWDLINFVGKWGEYFFGNAESDEVIKKIREGTK